MTADELAADPRSFQRYIDEYARRYAGGEGPSQSSFCGAEGDASKCGCWVHRLMFWTEEGIGCSNAALHNSDAPQ